MSAPAAIETRDALAPFVGGWVRCRGLAVRGDRDHAGGGPRTLVWRLELLDGGRWVRVADHVWAYGADLTRDHGAGVPVEFDAVVRPYQTTDPYTGVVHRRFGLVRPRNAEAVGPAAAGGEVLAAVSLLVRRFGWDAVADAVERLHGEG